MKDAESLTLSKDVLFCYLDAVDALVVVVIIHWVIWRQKDPFVVYNRRTALRWNETQEEEN